MAPVRLTHVRRLFATTQWLGHVMSSAFRQPTSTRFFTSKTPDASNNSRSSKPSDAPGPGDGKSSDGDAEATKLSKSIDWEDYRYNDVTTFNDLPSRAFGFNQHMIINNELKAALTQMLRQFHAPIMFCFAYGSGVFPQDSSNRSITDAEFRAVHPKPPEALLRTQKGQPKMIDFIFGVSHSDEWHWRNMRQHRDHYSGVASLGTWAVTNLQEKIGAGVYFNPYVVMNGMLIKYGVSTIDNLCQDLVTWDTLYLAGRLHKPVKILRDNAKVRIANQQNLVGAVRTALLMLPEKFTEFDLFRTIAGISYLGDPRMSLPTENRGKVNNIVANNFINFRRLYAPLIDKLPNIQYTGGSDIGNLDWVESPVFRQLEQDMDPVKRANMVRRLPSAFRSRLYFQYQAKFQITRVEFDKLMEASADEDATGIRRKQAGDFEMRIARDDVAGITAQVRKAIEQTIYWPSVTQSAKGLITSGFAKSARYLSAKWTRYGEGKNKNVVEAQKQVQKQTGSGEDKGERRKEESHDGREASEKKADKSA